MMNLKEKGIYTAFVDSSFETDKGTLRLYQSSFRFGDDENTIDGTWRVVDQHDVHYIVTTPDVGKFLVVLDLRMA